MKPAHAPEQDARPEPRGPAHALDPVCGMQVDPANARGDSAVHEGVEYSFCSTGCREKFIAHPVKYLQAFKAQVQLQRGTRSDPAVPAATAARPTPQRAGTGTLYVCPMQRASSTQAAARRADTFRGVDTRCAPGAPSRSTDAQRS